MVTVNVKSGKVHIVTILGIAGALLIVGFFFITFFMPASPEAIASRFLDALARGDAKTLAETSHIDGMSQDELRKQWDKTISIGKYYRFLWKISRSTTTGENGSVSLVFTRDFTSPSSYEENLELPVEKVNGQWRVSVGDMDSRIYPALPR